MVETLAEALPAAINDARSLLDEFKQLRGLANVLVEPQIAILDDLITRAITVTGTGDVVEMIRVHQQLREWIS